MLARAKLGIAGNVFRVKMTPIYAATVAAIYEDVILMNIQEIAKRAKVSTATVSRAINRVPTVNPNWPNGSGKSSRSLAITRTHRPGRWFPDEAGSLD